MLRFAPPMAIGILLLPVAFGILATFLPAFGFLPALGGKTISLAPFIELFATPGIWRSAGLSLMAGIVTTAIGLTIVMVFVAGWYGTPTFNKIQHLISPLLSVPHAAAAFGLVFLIAPSGMIFRLASPWLTGTDRPPDLLIVQDPMGLAMVAGLIMKEIPFLLLVTLAALPQTNAKRATHLARSIGYGPMVAFLHSTWPLVYRQIRLAIFAVIAYASSVVDVAIILGPSTPSTLAVRLTQWMSDPDLSMRFVASAGALLQLAITVTAILIWLILERICRFVLRQFLHSGRRFQSDQFAKIAGLGAITLSGVLIFSGLGILALWSVAGFWAFPDALPSNFTFENWNRAVPTLLRPLSITIGTATIATLIAVALALACMEREAQKGSSGGSRALLIIYLPLLVPQVSFVFGLQIFFLAAGADASWLALIFVHLIFVFPYVLLSLSDPWRAWDIRYANVSHGLGTSPALTFWRVRMPMLLKPILVATAVGFSVSIGQYLPTILIGAGRLPTITTEAVALASGGDRRIIGVYAFLQMALPFAGFLLATSIPAYLFRNRADMKANV